MTDPRQRGFSPELRERAVRLVPQHQGDHPSEWAAITSIAAKIGGTAETLRAWLRQANEILRKASVYFAQAELDRRFKR
jgi:transposase-like protein